MGRGVPPHRARRLPAPLPLPLGESLPSDLFRGPERVAPRVRDLPQSRGPQAPHPTHDLRPTFHGVHPRPSPPRQVRQTGRPLRRPRRAVDELPRLHAERADAVGTRQRHRPHYRSPANRRHTSRAPSPPPTAPAAVPQRRHWVGCPNPRGAGIFARIRNIRPDPGAALTVPGISRPMVARVPGDSPRHRPGRTTASKQGISAANERKLTQMDRGCGATIAPLSRPASHDAKRRAARSAKAGSLCRRPNGPRGQGNAPRNAPNALPQGRSQQPAA